MASSLPFYSVELDESDVPGAKLIKPTIEEHSVTELRRWLQCRGVKISGKKRELVERVKEHISKNAKISKVVDRGTWHQEKSRKLREGNLQNIQQKPPAFPINGWKNFPSKDIPKMFSYGSIYQHFIQVRVLTAQNSNFTVTSAGNDSDSNAEDEDDLAGTSKPLKKGRRYFISGHIKNMTDTLSKDHYCLKADVQSSYKEHSYKVMAMLNNKGSVADSSCECVASGMGRCSHVAGLLFALEDYTITFGYAPEACTSKLCSWNQGRQEKAPTIIADRQYSDKKDPKLKVEFIPYPTVSDDQQKNVDNLLYQCQSYVKPTMWEYLLEYNYPDYDIDGDRKKLLELCIKKLKESLMFNFDAPGEVTDTANQADSERWHQLRRILITASRCKEYFTVEPLNMFNKLKTMMWYPSFIENIYVKHGIKNEELAIKQYCDVTGYKVHRSGLWVNPKYVGLGASPDGLVDGAVSVTNISKGLLEVKCPYIIKNKHPTNLSDLTPQQLTSFCSVLGDDGHLHLKKDHKYYFQVQMQMAILERTWCDFLIWTFEGYEIERINFDGKFWDSVYPKLLDLHTKVISPEYFEMRVPRKLKPCFLNDLDI